MKKERWGHTSVPPHAIVVVVVIAVVVAGLITTILTIVIVVLWDAIVVRYKMHKKGKEKEKKKRGRACLAALHPELSILLIWSPLKLKTLTCRLQEATVRRRRWWTKKRCK